MMTAKTNPNKSHDRMPFVFVGHGSPINVIEVNTWSRRDTKLRDLVPQPQTILGMLDVLFLPFIPNYP